MDCWRLRKQEGFVGRGKMCDTEEGVVRDSVYGSRG